MINSKRVIVGLREHADTPEMLGFELVLDETGELPDVIIFDTWVFKRDGDSDQYIACTAAARLGGVTYGVPLKRIHYKHER